MSARNIVSMMDQADAARALDSTTTTQILKILGSDGGWSYDAWRFCMNIMGYEASLNDASASLIQSISLHALLRWDGVCGLIPEMIKTIVVDDPNAQLDRIDWARFVEVDCVRLLCGGRLFGASDVEATLAWLAFLAPSQLIAPHLTQHKVLTDQTGLQTSLRRVEVNGRMLPFLGHLTNLEELTLWPRGLALRLDALPHMPRLSDITIRCDTACLTHDELAWLINVLWASSPQLKRVTVAVEEGDHDLQLKRLLHLLDMIGLLDGGLVVELTHTEGRHE